MSALDGIHNRLQRTYLTLLSLVMAIACGALVMWDPHAFSEAIGGFNAANAVAIIWATCCSLIHGVGFKPKTFFWQLVFFPPLAWLVLLTTFLTLYT
ncbi:cyd operon protein YbgE [Veronia pacifica]|uniref:Cyd operon protein YbgE n=1 Tax=Veronia pacifica TaxID=1080227 RepID=A0A1C3ERT2_9GAMM|nr:cyd operon protein YbgE [Veronia pacifica]ODA35957.1 cyd operon protein YbgE [Veronia pacifica]